MKVIGPAGGATVLGLQPVMAISATTAASSHLNLFMLDVRQRSQIRAENPSMRKDAFPGDRVAEAGCDGTSAKNEEERHLMHTLL